MKFTFEIELHKEVAEHEKEIITKYWDFKEDVFVYRPSMLKNEYNFTQHELSKLVNEKSTCILKNGNCVGCGIELIYNVTSQTQFLKKINPLYIRCSECNIEYDKKLKQEREQNNITRGNQLQKEVIINRIWENLSSIELEVLHGIIKYKENREIYKKIHSRFGWDDTWIIVNKLEKIGLIDVIRDDSNKILKFDFLDELEYEILNNEEIENFIGAGEIYEEEIETGTVKNNLSFSITQKLNKKSANQPDYSGIFRLPNDIILKKETDYLYGGWIQSDGSINLKFTPRDEFVGNSTIQKDIENQPKHIKDIISNMKNNLDSFEDNNVDDVYFDDEYFGDDKNDSPF